MIDAFGWTWEYIDEEMTLPRLKAITERWNKIPPVSVSLAQIAMALGVKREPTKAKPLQRQSLFEDLMAAGAKPGRRPEWLEKDQAATMSK